MITCRPSEQRGHFDHGWLDTYHTFSFADYSDPAHMGFRDLRVINEDRVAPGQGFGTHSHRDMEIITVVFAGALEHKDSMGNGSVMRPGDVQRMSAGTGVSHSEFNHSMKEPVHLIQIWILPSAKGIKPGYEQRAFPVEERRRRLRAIAARDGRDGALKINQDVELFASEMTATDRTEHALRPGRHAWLQLVRGGVTLNGVALESGDGAAVSDETQLEIAASKPSELLLFDLA